MAFAVRKQIVAEALARLRGQKTHTLFAGYLCLQGRAARLGQLENLQPDFLNFFKRFFLVGNHPLGTPYIKPFTEQRPSPRNLWLNENVAGSYAPSSLRPGQPFRRVVSIEGRGYSLLPNHAHKAFEHLLFRNRVQAADLAVFLYRDFGFPRALSCIEELVEIFAFDFGYSPSLGSSVNEDFVTLFRLESAQGWGADWLEAVPIPEDRAGETAPALGRLSLNMTQEKIRVLTAEEILSLDITYARERRALREISIDGLLSFGEETRFVLGHLNILVGPNGSGKSNLIDCLRILQCAPFEIQDAFRKGGFEEWLYNGSDKRAGAASLEATALAGVKGGPIRHRLKLGPPSNSRAPLEEVVFSDLDSNDPEFHFVGSYRSGGALSVAGAGGRRRRRQMKASEYNPLRSILSQIRDATQYPELTSLSDFYSDFRIYSEWTFGRNSILREATPAGRSDTRLSESMDDLALALNALEQTAAHERIRVLLRELKETYRDFMTRVLFGRVGLELVEAPFDRLPLPANRLSDGTLRFLALAAILLQADPPSLICIEEPELGMHPDMIRLVAEMIVEASLKTQLIITTHSEHLLSALQDDFSALYAFDTGTAGSLVRRFDPDEFNEWREEHTLGELWTSGELGGNRW